MMQRIIQPPTREVFESRISHFCTKVWTKKVMRAWDICKEIHVGMRDDGTPYCDHPHAVAWILIEIVKIRNPRMIILALVHDTGEEKGKPFTSEDIQREYSDPVITEGHKAITKFPGQHPRWYTWQVFQGGVHVAIVKFCDRLHNTWTLGACDVDKQNRIITDTWMYYYPYSGEYTAFLRGATKKERETIQMLWDLINEGIDELIVP